MTASTVVERYAGAGIHKHAGLSKEDRLKSQWFKVAEYYRGLASVACVRMEGQVEPVP